jgi:phosphoribosyl 1,2-cyclic phosphodiesterase
VKLQLLGVRGSTQAPGSDFLRYGGHTSCVAITASGQRDPTLLLDAGTGIRSVADVMAGAVFHGSILLSHLHWDHVCGLPFFGAGDHPDSAVDVYLPAQDGCSGRDLLARNMSPPYFPIGPEGLRGSWSFRAVESGSLPIAGFEIGSADLVHKGGRTFGYRVSDANGSMAYLPDHSPALGVSDDALELITGVDVLLHDAQFLEVERAMADEYGHATVNDAIALAVRANVGSLVLTHHSPTRTDDELDLLAATVSAPMPVTVAAQGDVLEVSR